MPNEKRKGITAESRLILRRGRQVWRLVPAQHKWALGVATVVIAAVSACNISISLLLGALLDGVQKGTERGLGRPALYRVALWFLGLLAAAYVVREALNVLRR